MAKGKYRNWITDDGLLKIEGWAHDGLVDKQIAHNIGISEQTLNVWKKKFPSLSESLKRGKEVVDRQVENALLKRALGYDYEEITKERIVDSGRKKRHHGESELTQEQWELSKAYFANTCAYCGVDAKLTKDHLDPLHNGGGLVASNIVPACQSCNSSKKDNQWLSWYQKQKFYDAKRAQKITDYIAFVLSLPLHNDSKVVVTKAVTKHVAGDTTAQIFWLKNRKPNDWRDKHETEVSGSLNTNPFADLSEDELRKLARDGHG